MKHCLFDKMINGHDEYDIVIVTFNNKKQIHLGFQSIKLYCYNYQHGRLNFLSLHPSHDDGIEMTYKR